MVREYMADDDSSGSVISLDTHVPTSTPAPSVSVPPTTSTWAPTGMCDEVVEFDDTACCDTTNWLGQDVPQDETDDDTGRTHSNLFCLDNDCLLNVEAVGVGYNIATLKTQQRVFAQYYDDEAPNILPVRGNQFYIPDNCMGTSSSSSSSSDSTNSNIYTTAETYRATLSAGVDLTSAVPYSNVPAAGVSTTLTRTVGELMQGGYAVTDSKKHHIMVELELTGFQAQTCESDFATMAAILPLDYGSDKPLYETFLEMYGTHVVTKVGIRFPILCAHEYVP